MAVVRSSLSATEILQKGEPYFRSASAISEVLQGGSPFLRSQFLVIESVQTRDPNLRSQSLLVETLQNRSPSLRSALVIIETLIELLEEHMSTEVFPGIDPVTGQTAVLRGLAFDVVKKPQFSNKIVEHTSGEETATSYWENPRWEFTLTYDYLPDRPVSVGDTDLHQLMGFFLNRRGRFDTFLFQDPDEYSIIHGYQRTFDGVTVDFNLAKSIGGFYEPVGQINADVGYTIYLQAPEDHVIPASPGPYTVTVTHTPNSNMVPVVSIGGTVLTEVAGAPGLLEYNRAGDTFTFNSGQHDQTATIEYEYTVDPADYTLTLPNVIAFNTAPADGAIAYATFQFYYVCRFVEDASEYTKFMDKLWNLNELSFRSVIQ